MSVKPFGIPDPKATVDGLLAVVRDEDRTGFTQEELFALQNLLWRVQAGIDSGAIPDSVWG